MTQVASSFDTWTVAGAVLFEGESDKAEKDRREASPTSLQVYATTPQQAIEAFVAAYRADVRIHSVRRGSGLRLA